MNQQYSISKLEQERTGVTVVNREGEFVDVNETAAEQLRYDRDELIGMCSFEMLHKPKMDNMKEYGTLFDGDVNTWESVVDLGDGSIAEVTFKGQKDQNGVGDVLVSEIQEVNVLEDYDTPSSKEVTADAFEGVSQERLVEITANTRIDSPDGMVTLRKIIFDLSKTHNKIEKIKNGGFCLHDALDQRLAEEQEKNPNSDVAQVLKETSETAFGVYLRIKRGDDELHGNNDGEGEYSNYWN